MGGEGWGGSALCRYIPTRQNSFLNAIRTVYRPSRSGCFTLQSSDGSSLIKEQEGLRDRWAKNLLTSLNRPFTVEQAALPEQVSQQPVMERLDQPPTIDEAKKAISTINSTRASGKDSIPAEIFKAEGPKALEAFHDVLQSIWSEEDMAEDFHKPLIVALYKRKGRKSVCGNCQGRLTSFRKRKIFARIFLNWQRVSKRSLPEEQCG